jgi:divalent metal cation (Fe/Co/Zn/Cd) transporter
VQGTATLSRRLWLVVALVAVGAVVKTVGAVASGSRALLVDALTCFASLAGLGAVVYYLRLGSLPPDEDHPYGHSRFRYRGCCCKPLRLLVRRRGWHCSGHHGR